MVAWTFLCCEDGDDVRPRCGGVSCRPNYGVLLVILYTFLRDHVAFHNRLQDGIIYLPDSAIIIMNNEVKTDRAHHGGRDSPSDEQTLKHRVFAASCPLFARTEGLCDGVLLCGSCLCGMRMLKTAL